jgi:hypothetical protein
VVVLAGTFRMPEIVLRHEIDLADPWVRESMHPYHQELRYSGATGEQARLRGCRAARTASGRAIRALVNEMRRHGFESSAATVVASGPTHPARSGGAHARAHAEERRLYREAVEAALRTCGLDAVTVVENAVRAVAIKRLGRTRQDLDAALKAFSHEVGTPWRAPEKYAALAAWLALWASSRRGPHAVDTDARRALGVRKASALGGDVREHEVRGARRPAR